MGSSYLRNLKQIEEIVLSEVAVFEKINWDQAKEAALKGNQKEVKKLELATGNIAIKYLEEPFGSLNEVIINKEKGIKIARSVYSDKQENKIVTYGFDNPNTEAHSISYKNGTLSSVAHDYQGPITLLNMMPIEKSAIVFVKK